MGGDVGEVVCIIEVRLRESLDFLERGSVGHGIQVVPLWHLICLIVACLKERNKVN